MPFPLPAFLARHPGAGIAVLRIVTGLVFMVHGGQKLFVTGIGGVTAWFASMGMPLAVVMAPYIAILEFAGGIALVVGLLSRPVALLLVGDMLGAILFVHGRGGFFVPDGVEFVGMMATAALTIAVAGPGSFAADDALRVGRTGR